MKKLLSFVSRSKAKAASVSTLALGLLFSGVAGAQYTPPTQLFTIESSDNDALIEIVTLAIDWAVSAAVELRFLIAAVLVGSFVFAIFRAKAKKSRAM